ncbi:DUF397 domain-containing protein [Streptomyces himalayensis]|uniref:DUF397 domain-containing protein n=1 Tax=Streptomyces himalayensis subsp. himalayensis TaxID=2756131 RepID=A0A7W0DSH7_9ACTN|nr:DUF397 domain-containing protein [Streptomyces himalayensis]MBA2950401.1 DUF397 domain-containing protein [Streptomyces himalayensis subsp. himalayensis]
MSDLVWFKSSYSDSGGGDCVEAAFDWFKSSYSDSSGGDCLEVATTTAVHIRDSKAPDRPYLTVSSEAWVAFLTHPATRSSSRTRH